MGSNYVWGINPFQDFMFQSIMYNIDVSDKNLKNDIHNTFINILQNYLKNNNDIVYLDFKIINNNGYYKLIGNNMISALWFSGIIPNNVDSVLSTNKYHVDNIEYNYDKRRKILTFKHKKNDE